MRIVGVVVAIVAAFATLAPGSMVLCVAPGGHVAIENVNSGCCAPHAAPGASDHPGYRAGSTDNCSNCSDFPLMLQGCGLNCRPGDPNGFVHAHPAVLETSAQESALRDSPQSGYININISTPPAAHLSALLRC